MPPTNTHLPHNFFPDVKILYTVLKADFYTFCEWSDLVSNKHNPEAEVDDSLQVIHRAKKALGRDGTDADVASTPVDNAA